MCLIAFAIGVSRRWPLVIAANRDEFFDRPTLPLARWQTAAGHSIISGRDLQAGGTWLGLSSTGRIAMLTNVRELPQTPDVSVRSRGDLVMRWLDGAFLDADAMTAEIDPQAYAGFNLVVGDLATSSWSYLSNRIFIAADTSFVTGRPLHSGWSKATLGSGLYGLSNAALDTPWAKTLTLKKSLASALQAKSKGEMEAQLWEALANREKAADADLPDTGLPAALETALSSAFISEAASNGRKPYGTRCSTLVVAQQTNAASADKASRLTLSIEELTHQQHAPPKPGRRFSFDVDAAAAPSL